MAPFDEDVPQSDAESSRSLAAAIVSRPSASLIILSLLSIATVSISAAFDFAAVAGRADEPREAWMIFSHQQQRTGRFAASVALVGFNIVTLVGAIKMRSLRSYRWAMAACGIASTPCIAPCYLLSIPFGLWGILVLGKPEVRRAFRESQAEASQSAG
ncbi:MAG: hypothetical protein QGG36_06300 [Pirellulaceae bacterium]|jgi:hypothetical protein|nr:hypothetical protein [Pirellulaceae bacterium]MDP7015389.1 hypothetical protein [Pirellulaceae bacterium]